MTLYVDASAFVKRHTPEEELHVDCLERMADHSEWDADLTESILVDVDQGVVALARAIAFETGLSILDSIHVASAKRIPDPDLVFLTYDDRQAVAAAADLRLARMR